MNTYAHGHHKYFIFFGCLQLTLQLITALHLIKLSVVIRLTWCLHGKVSWLTIPIMLPLINVSSISYHDHMLLETFHRWSISCHDNTFFMHLLPAPTNMYHSFVYSTYRCTPTDVEPLYREAIGHSAATTTAAEGGTGSNVAIRLPLQAWHFPGTAELYISCDICLDQGCIPVCNLKTVVVGKYEANQWNDEFRRRLMNELGKWGGTIIQVHGFRYTGKWGGTIIQVHGFRYTGKWGGKRVYIYTVVHVNCSAEGCRKKLNSFKSHIMHALMKLHHNHQYWYNYYYVLYVQFFQCPMNVKFFQGSEPTCADNTLDDVLIAQTYSSLRADFVRRRRDVTRRRRETVNLGGSNGSNTTSLTVSIKINDASIAKIGE